jgi:hypothetical protein
LAKSVPDSHFGNQDQFYRSLEILCDDINNVPGISWYGRQSVENDLTNNILARNAIMKWVQDRPQIADIPIRRPLIVCGLPRTGEFEILKHIICVVNDKSFRGSTLLYHLLAQDPLARSPNLYEMSRWEKVVPPFTEDDPQYDMLKKAGQAQDNLLPG